MSSLIETYNESIKDIIDDIINKIEINEYNSDGDTQLTIACSKCDHKSVQKLLMNGENFQISKLLTFYESCTEVLRTAVSNFFWYFSC